MMRREPRQRELMLSSAMPILLATATGAAIGSGLLLTSGPLILAVCAAVGTCVVVMKRPELGLLAIVATTATIVFEYRLPLIPIGVGSLHLSDGLLLGLLGLVAVRGLAERGFRAVRTPLDWLLIGFWATAVLSTGVAMWDSSVDYSLGIRGIRVITYYLTFLVVTNLVRDKRQLSILLKGVLMMASVVAAAMIIQFVAGDAVSLLPGRVETLQTQGIGYTGVTRVLPPGQSIVLVGLVIQTVALVLDRPNRVSVLEVIQWGMCGVAVIISFTRSFWIQVAFAVAVLAYLANGRERGRLARMVGLVIPVAGLCILLGSQAPGSRLAELLAASRDRLVTLSRVETLGEGSLEWRYVENSYVVPQLVAHPVLGLGLGASYRPVDARIDSMAEGWDARRYIHNGHFWILMMAGPFSYLFLIVMSAFSVVRGLKYWRIVSDHRMRIWVLGSTLTLASVPVGALVNPIYMQWFWTPVLGILMGFNEQAIRILARRSRTRRKEESAIGRRGLQGIRASGTTA